MASAAWLWANDWLLSRHRLPYRSGSRVIVVLGDEQVGKSTLIAAWGAGKWRRWEGTMQSNEPRGHELSLKSPVGAFYVKEVDGRKPLYALEFSMSAAVCCVLCVSLANKMSLESVTEKWVQAVKKYCGRDTAMVIVGTKSDQRKALEMQQRKLRRDECNAAKRIAGAVPDSLLEQGSGAFTIDMLPEEVLQRIFVKLCLYDRCRAAEVCWQWAAVVRDDFLWPGLIRGIPVSTAELRSAGKQIGADAVVECTTAKTASVLGAMRASVASVRR